MELLQSSRMVSTVTQGARARLARSWALLWNAVGDLGRVNIFGVLITCNCINRAPRQNSITDANIKDQRKRTLAYLCLLR
jgi:hypothetical protein